MCDFDEICRKHDIKYYLSGGTNLGALRHKGFIPWDDDADIRIPRKEYLKLEAIVDQELKEGEELVSHKRYPNYTSPISRFVNRESTCIPKVRMTDGAPHGVYLDIVILDPMPREEPELTEWKKNHYVYCEVLEDTLINAARNSSWEWIDYDRYNMYMQKVAEVGKEAVLEELENKLFTIDEKDADNYCMRFGSVWLGVSPIDWYGTPRDVPFEDKSFYIAEKAELCAFENYGLDWRYIPDMDIRTGHTTLQLNELDSGNCERETLSILDIDEVRKINRAYKKERLNYFKLKQEVYYDRAKPYIRYLNCKITKEVKAHGADYFVSNPAEGKQLFREYMALQLELPFYRNNKFVPLEDDNADLLCDVCIANNQISKLHQMLVIRQDAKGSLNEHQQEAMTFCSDITEMMKSLDLGEYEKAAETVKAYEGNTQLSFVRGKIQSDLHFADSPEEFENVKKYIESMLELYPDDGDLLKYYGDAFRGCGDEATALSMYEKAAVNTTNGLILMDLAGMGITRALKHVEGLCKDDSEDIEGDEEIAD